MKNTILVLIGLFGICACAEHHEIVVRSFSVRLVHPANPQTTDRGLVNGIDLSGYFPVEINPNLKNDDQSVIYWVSDVALLDTSEIKSIKVTLPPKNPLILSKEEYAEQERQLQNQFPDMSMDTYEHYLEINSPPPAVLQLSFSTKGKEKLATVTRDNEDKRLAIIINDKIITAPYVREEIDSGLVNVNLHCTPDKAKAIIQP